VLAQSVLCDVCDVRATCSTISLAAANAAMLHLTWFSLMHGREWIHPHRSLCYSNSHALPCLALPCLTSAFRELSPSSSRRPCRSLSQPGKAHGANAALRRQFPAHRMVDHDWTRRTRGASEPAPKEGKGLWNGWDTAGAVLFVASTRD
jgi:hypothetical protein